LAIRVLARPDPEPAATWPRPMSRIRQTFAVPFAYDVVFTRDAFDAGNPALVDAVTAHEPTRRHRLLVVFDAGFAEAWPEAASALRAYVAAHALRLELAGEPVSVVGGEAAKNDPALVGRLHEMIHARHLDRQSFLLVVGGGAVLDAVGYAAATAHRGIRVVRMPTTVLSQCDSGVGVKNGVNAFGAKNFAGTFAPPFAVLSDGRFLERLPARDRVAGLAEAVKVALVRDAGFFEALEAAAGALAGRDSDVTDDVIRRCAELHLGHIARGGDPFEQGSARPLDFGHWAAHKLETLTDHELRHGEAVAIGLLLDSRYAFEAGLLGEPELARIEELLVRLGLPRWHPALAVRRPAQEGPGGAAGPERPAVLDGVDEFREHLGGELTITLLEGIGRPVDVHRIDGALVERALAWLEERHRR
jgi:3-dehydroquinate synthase